MFRLWNSTLTSTRIEVPWRCGTWGASNLHAKEEALVSMLSSVHANHINMRDLQDTIAELPTSLGPFS